MIDIDNLLKEAIKSKDITKRECFKIVKSKFQEWSTSKQNVGKAMDDTVQFSILKKLKEEYEEDAKMYESKMSGSDIAKQYKESASIISSLLPKEASEEDIRNALDEFGAVNKTTMGAAIKFIKSKFPTADGKKVSEIVKSKIG